MKSLPVSVRLFPAFPFRIRTSFLKPMNIPTIRRSLGWLGLCLTVFNFNLSAADTAFRFEGGLLNGAQPANGTYDMTFELFDAQPNRTLRYRQLIGATGQGESPQDAHGVLLGDGSRTEFRECRNAWRLVV